MREKIKNEAWEWTKAITLALILAFIVRHFVFATSIVEGTSMEPTLEDGERVLYNKMVYLVGEPDRGDIVIIQRPTKNYVKRVVGLPGDKVEVRDHTLYVNDKKVDQEYLNQEAIKETGDFSPVTIPKDKYFVMGDNRDISKDSRTGLGYISHDEIIGRSELIISPFDEWSWTR
ncbi:signal peptidase I [Pontibacillus sp. HMF3514]|uniref:signal peptidase I n=1 Tax=Pontibacillus sp. HMF3514 TaxID=2692425 RepID=UPI00131FB0FB|nr:signal peptidase I [Pontibacillus sp. HMF3514]QHE51988.1 signal peptidase I [Pontibacillus sp. HMF3514]